VLSFALPHQKPCQQYNPTKYFLATGWFPHVIGLKLFYWGIGIGHPLLKPLVASWTQVCWSFAGFYLLIYSFSLLQLFISVSGLLFTLIFKCCLINRMWSIIYVMIRCYTNKNKLPLSKLFPTLGIHKCIVYFWIYTSQAKPIQS